MARKRIPAPKHEPVSFDTNPTRRRARQGKANKKTVKCEVCGEKFRSITHTHLAKHGFTLERYRRVYCKPTKAPDVTPGELMAKAVSAELVERPAFLHSLADEVEDHLSAGKLRSQLVGNLGAILANRGVMLAKAAAQLTEINGELSQEWRIKQGGQQGGPTETKDLVNMGHLAHAQVVKAEEAFLKTAKLLHEISGGGDGDIPANRFTGSAEGLELPDNITPGDREILRTLTAALAKGARKTSEVVIDKPATVKDTPAPAGVPESVSGAPSAPTDEAHEGFEEES